MLEYTGERFLPELSGNIELEHKHRYLYALAYAKGKVVLDIASGEGYGTALLASQAARVYGVDISEEAVAHAKEKYKLPNVEYRQGTCAKIPLPDNTVDFLVSFETIEHHTEHEQMLAEIKRVLKPGGLVLVSSPDKETYTDKPNYHNPYHIKELYKNEFETLFRLNFRNVDCLGQKVTFGSFIIPEEATPAHTFTSMDLLDGAPRPGLTDAIYNLVLASDEELPAAPPSFLDGTIGQQQDQEAEPGPTMEQLWDEIGQRDTKINVLLGDLEQLKAEVGKFEALTQHLRSSEAEKENQIRDLIERIRMRDVALSHVMTRYSALSLRATTKEKKKFSLFAVFKQPQPLPEEPYGVATIRHSAFFEAGYYLNANPDVAATGLDAALHYFLYGGSEKRDPGPYFSTNEYFRQYPDVAAAGVNPLAHYEWQGAKESRNPPVPAADLEDASHDVPVIEPTEPNYVTLYRGSPLTHKLAKLICFYLPQFHRTPENDAWWGEGFTEWTNVKSGQPKFEGHYQPRVPGELGYYNLLDPEVQRRQIELAKLYGIEGFCFYFYWFGGKRLLERPVENYLKDETLDLPFCLCWANENWTRRWDGLDHELLIAQDHSPEDDIACIQELARYVVDARYIRIDGKPLIVLYRPSLLPSPKETAQRWRQWCRDNGIGEIYLACTQSFEKTDPAEYGFDAAIEFPPNACGAPEIAKKVFPDRRDDLKIYDAKYLLNVSERYAERPYKTFRGVCLNWDNTPRRKNDDGTVFVNGTPSLYRRWLSNAISDTQRRFFNPDERLVFINAWNEWAEGTYLEPDAGYGYAYLQATRDAVKGPDYTDAVLLVTHDCHPHGAQFQTLAMAKQFKASGFRIAIVALGSGKLFDDFCATAETFNAESADASGLRDFLERLKLSGVRDAITSTVVSGSIVGLLKDLDYRVLSLIHELPGVIRDMNQMGNAQVIVERADKVVFPSDLVYRRFDELCPVDVAKVVIRHQGLLRANPYKNRKTEAYGLVAEKHNLPAGAKIVLSVAFTDERKAPDLLVESAALVLKTVPDAIFIWIGAPHAEMEKKFLSRIQELSLEDRVLFVGFERDPTAYFAAASVYALPSREDPFPNVILEAADVDVPVVAFEGATGAGDFIKKQGGCLARYLDIEDFAQQICHLLAGEASGQSKSVPTLQRYNLDLLHELNGFPRISVVVPNYNYERYLVPRLDSIFHQSFPIYEVIVLDDASSDGSVGAARAYSERTGNEFELIVNARNSGSVFHQWKAAAERSEGDLLWIAEADDLAESCFLNELAPVFKDPDVTLAFSQSQQIDEDGNLLAENYLDYTKDISDRWSETYGNDGTKEIGESFVVKNVIPNVSAVVFQRKALIKAFADMGDKLFTYKVAGDWLVYLHVLVQGKMHYDATSLNRHRRHTNSVTHTLDGRRHFEEVCELQGIAGSLSSPTPETLAIAAAYIEYLRGHFGLLNEARVLKSAEALAAHHSFNDVLMELRQLTLDEFGYLLVHMPNESLPELSKVLPPMAPAQVQINWTGSSGISLLKQTYEFVKVVQEKYAALTGGDLKNKKILDYGCGYGRIIRMMYYFTQPQNIFGVDPWDESIRLCQESRLPGNFFVSDYVPKSLPLAEKDFDLIYCFSVFTHLSLKTTRVVLKLLRQYIAKDGVLVITIRQEDYWKMSGAYDLACKRAPDDLIAEHREHGFAFVPHGREPIDGDITYGDSSMSLEWLAAEFPEWKIETSDYGAQDPYQLRVFMRPQ